MSRPLPPVILVVGAPRSGTSWLHQMLAQHTAIAGLGDTELTLFSRYLAPWAHNFAQEKRDNDAGRWSQGLPVIYSTEEFEERLREFTRDVYERVHARKPEATHVIDKHPNYSNHLPLIDRLLPHCRVIHIIRDGREVVVSMMSARRRIGHSPGEVRSATREWHRCVTNARAYGAELGTDRYLEVRYEDLMRDRENQLRRTFDFCGVPTEDSFIAGLARSNDIQVKQVSGGDASLNALRATPSAIWKLKLSTAERWILDRMAGRLLRSLGYAQDGWWAVGPLDRLRMLPYGLFARIKRSAEALRTIWSTPVEERLP